MKKETVLLIVKLLACFGIALAVYLLWEQFFHPTFQVCNLNSTINCNAIISGEVAKTLGIPTPLYGLAGYICILIAGVLQKKKTILGLASAGLAFCLYIAYVELVLLHTICPICILCQITMISVFILAIILVRKKS